MAAHQDPPSLITGGTPKLRSVPILTSNQDGRHVGKTEFSHLDFHLCIKKTPLRDFPVGPGVTTPCFPLQGAQVPSLVRELRSCMLHSMAKKVKNMKLSAVPATPPSSFSCSATSLSQEMLYLCVTWFGSLYFLCLFHCEPSPRIPVVFILGFHTSVRSTDGKPPGSMSPPLLLNI